MGDGSRIPGGPVMRLFRPAALLVATFVAGGCRLDLTEIPSAAKEAELSLSVVAPWEHAVGMQAVFRPGLSADGAARDLDNDSLVLNGVPIPPDSAGEGYRHYTVSGLELDALPLHVRAPSVLGLAESPPDLIVSPIRIVAPDTIVAGRPGILEVRLAGVEAEVDSLLTVHWSVTILPDTGDAEILSYSGRTVPDSLLSVPSTLLRPDLTRGWMFVQGMVEQKYGSAAGGYQFDIRRLFSGAIPFRIEN